MQKLKIKKNRSVQETKYSIKQDCLCKASRLLLWRVMWRVFQGFEKSSHDNILFVVEEAMHKTRAMEGEED